MAPPAGFTDFWELELQINYNNSPNPYLQNFYAGGGLVQPPQEKQAGWNERHCLLPSQQTPLGPVPLQNAYTLVQARAAVLGINFYIKKAIIHQASVFKSSYPMPFSASKALWDSLATGTTTNSQLCSAPEENLLLRCEANSLYRWEQGIRGIKDYVSDDTMSYFAATSYADQATFNYSSQVFDTEQLPVPPVGTSGGSPAQFTVTNVNGSINTAVLSSGGSYPGVANGTYWCYFYSSSGQTIPAFGYVVIAGNVATSATISTGGAGYTGTSVYVPVSNDCSPSGTTLYGLPNYLTPQQYWANLISCLISFTQSGTTRRIAQSTFTAPVPTFPSGLAPAIYGTPAKANRCMVQRVGNRQTGKIRLTKPARRKIAR